MSKINTVNYEIDISTLIPSSDRGQLRIMRPDEIIISHGEYNKEKKRCKRVKVRIGNEIMKHLKWTHKDKLQMLNFPDDIARVVIVKRGAGCSAVTASGTLPFWQFSLLPQLKFIKSAPFVVAHEIHKLGYVIFRLDNPHVS